MNVTSIRPEATAKLFVCKGDEDRPNYLEMQASISFEDAEVSEEERRILSNAASMKIRKNDYAMAKLQMNSHKLA